MSATPQEIAKLLVLTKWMSQQKDLRPCFNINDAAWLFTPGYDFFNPPLPEPPWPQPKPSISLEAFLAEREFQEPRGEATVSTVLPDFLGTQLCLAAATY